jgi:hypothetical protein
MDAVNWPSTRTYQLALSQIAGLSHHYNPHVFIARLLSAGSILGCSRGPYSPSGIDDFLFEIVHSAMIPEMRSFVADGLKALASSKWNAEATDAFATPQEIRTGVSKINQCLDKYLTDPLAFESK